MPQQRVVDGRRARAVLARLISIRPRRGGLCEDARRRGGARSLGVWPRVVAGLRGGGGGAARGRRRSIRALLRPLGHSVRRADPRPRVLPALGAARVWRGRRGGRARGRAPGPRGRRRFSDAGGASDVGRRPAPRRLRGADRRTLGAGADAAALVAVAAISGLPWETTRRRLACLALVPCHALWLACSARRRRRDRPPFSCPRRTPDATSRAVRRRPVLYATMRRSGSGAERRRGARGQGRSSISAQAAAPGGAGVVAKALAAPPLSTAGSRASARRGSFPSSTRAALRR